MLRADGAPRDPDRSFEDRDRLRQAPLRPARLAGGVEHRGPGGVVGPQRGLDNGQSPLQDRAGLGHPVQLAEGDADAQEGQADTRVVGSEPRAGEGRVAGPLPGSREEAEALREAFGSDAAVWLGEEASERHAKSLDRSVSVIHFACHGVVDEELPLDSALVLAPSADGQENGLLQAWEVLERVRLDADLVTLSACDTGLGKVVGGEGVIGLTRAFQYAGARTVVASLWSVADASTAELMRRFYRHLRSGLATDEALRAAQLELARGPTEVAGGDGTTTRDLSHPFHWAAFVVVGDHR